MDHISYDDFLKVDIRVGRVVQVDDFPKARKPAYKLRIDFGPLGVKASSAQITRYYEKEDLLGKQVLAVVNFPPRQIGGAYPGGDPGRGRHRPRAPGPGGAAGPANPLADA